MKIALNLEGHFDAAHRLMHHAGKCFNIHGHIWKVRLKVEGTMDDPGGMLVDFKDLKKDFYQFLDYYDHSLILNKDDSILAHELACLNFDGRTLDITYIDGEPSCENIAKRIFDDLSKNLSLVDDTVKVVEIEVWESEGASAIYKGE